MSRMNGNSGQSALGTCRDFSRGAILSPLPEHPVSIDHFQEEALRFGDYQQALQTLSQYHILRETRTAASTDTYSLTTEFASSLQKAFAGVDIGSPFGETVPHPQQSLSATDLDQYSRQQCENLLNYIVGSASGLPALGPTGPSPAIVSLLEAGDLITFQDSTTSHPTITQAGFSFVLQDLETQLWFLIFLYVYDAAGSNDSDAVDILAFVFRVASSEPRLPYSSEKLNHIQQGVLGLLGALGIVYQPEDATYYYPTRLATILASNATGTSRFDTSLLSSKTHRGFIIVETNYRVYAYTSSDLQIALLSLFVTLRSRHPNLVTGKLTRASVQRALRRGISAQQIIAYLSAHCHPQMRCGRARQMSNELVKEPSSVLPATITDQIHLWQLERDRMTVTHGFLLQGFGSADEYRTSCRRASDLGLLDYKHDGKRELFVNLVSVDGLKSFMRMAR